MSGIAELADVDEEAALARAVKQSGADPWTSRHHEVRAWLFRLAAGGIDAEPPQPR